MEPSRLEFRNHCTRQWNLSWKEKVAASCKDQSGVAADHNPELYSSVAVTESIT